MSDQRAHQLIAIKYAKRDGYRVVVLKWGRRIANEDWEEGPYIRGEVEIEGTDEHFEEMFGEGYDVGDNFGLVTLTFEPVEVHNTGEPEHGREQGHGHDHHHH